ncbi:unnamed protein product, partial [Polarella glacialis]
ELQDTQGQYSKLTEASGKLQENRRELEIAQVERQQLKLQQPKQQPGNLESECSGLRAKVCVLENEISGLQSELTEQRTVSTTLPTEEHTTSGRVVEETPLLGAAYHQISVLNTQLAHLYAELTLARTEVSSLRAGQSRELEDGSLGPPANSASSSAATAEATAAESQRQAQQIADLVSDIRHLQLDLEYHQQKVDQLLEDKQLTMKDLKRSQNELLEAQRMLEEKDQLLKHQEVDLEHLRQHEMHSNPRGPNASLSMSDDGMGMLDALRSLVAVTNTCNFVVAVVVVVVVICCCLVYVMFMLSPKCI